MCTNSNTKKKFYSIVVCGYCGDTISPLTEISETEFLQDASTLKTLGNVVRDTGMCDSCYSKSDDELIAITQDEYALA